MKRLMLYSTLIWITGVTACDNTFDFIADINQAPSIAFDEGMVITQTVDSMKTSLKTGQEFYEITLYAADPEKAISSISFEFIDGFGQIYRDDSLLEGSIANPGNVLTLHYQPTNGLTHTIRFRVTDTFGAHSFAHLTLHVFNNTPPVADFSIENIALNDSKEFELDASESFDTDFEFGGRVNLYEWTLDGVVVLKQAPNAKIRHIFGATGKVEVFLRVQDNDGAYSAPVSKIINVH